jgi:hypothetical protein
MRYALVIAMLLGWTLLAQAEPIARDKWIAQTARASKSCLAKFRQKFGEDKAHNYSVCVKLTKRSMTASAVVSFLTVF